MSWSVAGQERAVALLSGALEKDRIANAYLLVGPPQVGKTTLALNLAQALNCLGERRPCLLCPQCRRIASGRHPDVQFLEPGRDGGKSGELGIDTMKALKHSASLTPVEARYRVFIIERAELMTREAANSLLKTLEEPPPNVVLILTAVDEESVLATIRSRCQRIPMGPIPKGEMARTLEEKWGVPYQEAFRLAALSKGALGWAITAWANPELLKERQERRDEMIALTEASLEKRLAFSARWSVLFQGDREKALEVLTEWLEWWRYLMLMKCGGSVPAEDKEAFEALAQGYDIRRILSFLQHLREALRELDQNANPRLVMDVLLLNMLAAEKIN